VTAIHWKSQVTDNFDDTADWSTGTVPGAADDAILDAKGTTPYSVIVTDSHTVSSIQTHALATLDITAGNFTALNGTGSGRNVGTIAVGDGAAFTVGGAFDNRHGTISLESAGAATRLIVAAGGATFSGGGRIILGDNTRNQVRGAAATATLTNVDNTISGAGQLGNGELTLVNEAAGVIDATGAHALILNTEGETAINDGLIEAGGAGGLTILGTTVNNAGGGVIEALGGSSVTLKSADIMGGVLEAQAGGLMHTADSGSLLDGLTAGALTLIGRFHIADGDALTVQGQIDLAQAVGGVAAKGKLQLDSAGDQTTLIVAAAGATFTGGQVILTDNAANLIEGTLSGPSGAQSVSALTNTGAISGAGTIGAELAITNTGTIDAVGANALVVSPGDTVNTGTLEATNPGALAATGGLSLTGVGVGIVTGATIANAGGTIEANGVNTHVDLYDVTVSGGTLAASGGGSINVDGYAAVFDGTAAALNNRGTVNVGGGDQLLIEGDINNTGTIAFGSEAHGGSLDGGFLEPVDNASLTGGGTIALNTDHAYGGLIIGGVGTSLTNVDNTISGDGSVLFGGGMTLVNEAKGVIDGSGTAATLFFWGEAPFQNSLIENDGLIEGTSAEGVTLYRVIINGPGVIFASAGSNVIINYSTIVGGTLDSAGGGLIQIQGETVLDGTASAVRNKGTASIFGSQRSQADLTIQGAVINTGTIAIDAESTSAGLFLGAVGATLSGGGTVALIAEGTGGAVPENFIQGSGGPALTNVDNTISGSGSIGLFDTDFILINQARGVIDSTYNGLSLTLDTGAHTVANAGLIEATDGASILIQSAIANDGTIEADGGDVAVNAAVSGAGTAVIAAGTLSFASTFDENVSFKGGAGALALAQSQSYGGTITGFSKTGGTSLDLADIGFVSSTEATFSGTKAGGVLIVTDGVHTAHINLAGNYLSSVFTAASDGAGGVIVTDPEEPAGQGAVAPPSHQFIAAMAGLGAGAGVAIHAAEETHPAAIRPMLATPRTANFA
jgi:hypothetical protein